VNVNSHTSTQHTASVLFYLSYCLSERVFSVVLYCQYWHVWWFYMHFLMQINHNNNSSAEQDTCRHILQIGQHTHLSICRRNCRYMAWDGHWAHTRDWQAYHHYHGRHPGDNIPFPTPFHGSANRKCGFFLQHHGHRVNCRWNHDFVSLA